MNSILRGKTYGMIRCYNSIIVDTAVQKWMEGYKMELGDILAVLEAYQNNPLVNNPSKESFREARRLLKKYRAITKIIDKWLKDPDDRFSEDYLTDIYDVIKDS